MRLSRPALSAAALALTATLAACSGNGEEADTTKASSSDTTVQSSEAQNDTSDKDAADEDSEAHKAAVTKYTEYVRGQVASLQGVGKEFIAAIEAGNVDEAKRLYPVAREPYERIEPVAESFGDLDARIDLREADLEDGDSWSGFHKIEKDLWVENKITDSTKKDAQQLSKDIEELAKKVDASDYTLSAEDIAAGAQELLDEVSTSKITGEENVFSHTDLYDFQANVEGSKAAIDSLSPILSETKPELIGEIQAEFGKVQSLLGQLREGDGFVSYDKVDDAKRKELSSALDALTAKVAQAQEAVEK
ncbi:iron uptake system protein EfeO [Corynebacterium pseudopelargi]|uniref:Iron uptake system component EfeO n=1 Tax=Corynebacterium pseudopelargi TaxID=2080757 RepID=A0A3G6IV19_9CORY|nr:iron uptake system protein EfeO [Corynebacterium pseudopelargi]AZA09621.1 Iron uptake system component EfeO precursor [Corynebacterium pseudopelargi]